MSDEVKTPAAEAPAAAPTGAPPPAPTELSAYQRRRERERERERKKEAARAKRADREVAKAKEEAATPAAPLDDDRDDAQRARETGGAWRLTLRLVGWCLWPFGYRLEPLTDKQVAEDTALLAPLARRHRWLDLLIRYAALPYLLVERIVTQLRRREKDKAQAPAAKEAA